MLDIAPFGYETVTTDPPAIELRWDEPRDLVRVVLRFAPGARLPDSDQIRVLYWRRVWPESRWEERGSGSGPSSWAELDDWDNGEWQRADVESEVSEETISFSFGPLARAEFPDLPDYSVTFRRTVKLRIELPAQSVQPHGLQTLVDAEMLEAEVCVHWDEAEAGEGRLEGYNCEVTSLAPLGRGGKAEILGTVQWLVPAKLQGHGLRVGVRYAASRGDDHPDRSILTVRCPGRGFSFLVKPVAEGEVIHAQALGVRAWPALLGENPPEPPVGKKTVYDRIRDMPEQSYERAMAAMPPRKSFYFVLGCEGGRQKFWIEPDGDIFCPPNFIKRVPGRDTPKLKGEGLGSCRFGLDKLLRTGRYIEDGYLPIVHTSWLEGTLRVEQTAFAAPACTSILAGPTEGDDPVAAFLKFRFTNTGRQPVTARLPVRAVRVRQCWYGVPAWDAGIPSKPVESSEPLALAGDLALAPGEAPGESWLRLVLSCSGGSVAERQGALVYEAVLGPQDSSELVVKMPFVVLDETEQVAALRTKDFERAHGEVRRFWQERVSEGCQIATPELDLNDFYRAHLTHMLITNDREIGSDRIVPRVGALSYGNCANESCMCIANLIARGYEGVGERCLETLLHYQGTVGMAGNFTSQEGQFFGSGGYEHELGENFIQHQGWVLWGLAQHYLYTRDAEWLQRVSPNIVRGCEWIINERRATMLTDVDGRKVLEWGMLPAAGKDDAQEWRYWLSNNVFSWWGLHWVAKVLAEVDHPDGARLVAEAEAYRQDILASFREAALLSPLVRLRDDTCVPHFPSRLYLRGRSFGWMRETLDGSLNLICTELLDPNSDEASWIVKDYEDNRYLSARYGYSLEDEERWWFDRGGFSVQPNLLQGPISYLLRDDVPHYLRAYFNSFAVTFRRDTRVCTEHPMPTLADWAGDHFKTSDEAQSAHWLRLMFVQERGDELCLGRALPRRWLEDGSRIAIRRAMTHFGAMSMEIESAVARGQITVRLDPPRRNPPSRIRLRLRHPDEAPIQSVKLDGMGKAEWTTEDDWIELPPLDSPTTITASY